MNLGDILSSIGGGTGGGEVQFSGLGMAGMQPPAMRQPFGADERGNVTPIRMLFGLAGLDPRLLAGVVPQLMMGGDSPYGNFLGRLAR